MYLIIIGIIVTYIIWYMLFNRKWPKFEPKSIPEKNSGGKSTYANTWYIIMDSRDLATNSVKAFELCEQQLVAFRGPSGAVHVLSAYCPHLGANLGVGGHVVTESESGDDCIQCPFHGWMFGGRDGQCKSIPNLEKSELKPLNARVKCWPVIEKNEMIYVWYHSGDQEPDHYPPDLSVKYNNPKLTLLSTINYNIYTTPQQVIENLLDTEHLQYVHTVIIPGIVSLKYYTSGEGTWDKPLTIRADILVFGIYVCRIQYDYRAVTPAYGEYEYSSVGAPGVTPLVMILSGVCLGPEKSLINTRLLGTPTLWTRIFVWLFHYLFYLQMLNDKPIWDNMVFPQTPVLTKNDRKVVRIRRLFQKFYD